LFDNEFACWLPNTDIKLDYDIIFTIKTHEDWFNHLETMNQGIKKYQSIMKAFNERAKNEKRNTLKIIFAVVVFIILLILIIVIHSFNIYDEYN
jgi:hypothetical protein